MRTARSFNFRLPSCATPSGYPREPGGSRPSHRLPDDTPRLSVGLSAGPVGHRQPGSHFPDHRRWGRWSGYHTIPDPTFGTRSRGISASTCPGRPTVNPQGPPQVCLDRDRATASQPSRSPLSAERARISPRTPLPRQRNVCGGHNAAPSGPRYHPGRRST
jgi:hypothetical protein